MRSAPIVLGCIWATLLTGCYSPPPTGEKSYVLPGNSNALEVGTGGSSTTGGDSNVQVALGGSVSGLFAGGTLVLSNGGSETTVTRPGTFAFPDTITVGQAYSVTVAAQPGAQECLVTNGQGVASAAGTSVVITCQLQLRFKAGQNATTVIGQTDFNSYARNFNQLVAAANSVSNPWGVSYTSDSGVVYLADSLNNRILGFNSLPDNNGPTADFLAGEPNFAATTTGCSATTFGYLAGVDTDHRGGLMVTDMLNNRVLLFADEFTSATDNPTPTGVVGQTSLNSNTAACNATGLNRPLSSVTDGNFLAVSDASNNRVLLWSPLPSATSAGAAATLVLGQPNLSTCNIPGAATAQTINTPQGLWTDGQSLAVVAVAENRILVWQQIQSLLSNPNNGAAADVVIGQSSFSGSAAAGGPDGLSGPQYVISDGTQLFVADAGNNRVLIYSNLNLVTGQAANNVLGQPNLTTVTVGGGMAGMKGPDGLGISGTNLIVADGANNRFLVYSSN